MSVLTLETDIPDSTLPYPDAFWDRIKYLFWKAIAPIHPLVRDGLLKAGILHHEGRQDFKLGKLAEGRTLDDFLHYLHALGFGNHFIAWNDTDQIISLRKLVGFEWQYHLRIFNDGEVRGHYEYTPECHPILHTMDGCKQERRDDFMNFVGDWVTEER